VLNFVPGVLYFELCTWCLCVCRCCWMGPDQRETKYKAPSTKLSASFSQYSWKTGYRPRETVRRAQLQFRESDCGRPSDALQQSRALVHVESRPRPLKVLPGCAAR